MQLVEREVEFEYVDPLFAEDAQQPVLRLFGDDLRNLSGGQVAPLRPAAPGTRRQPA